MSDWKEEG